MNFCPQCGTKFEPEARFCEECGYDSHSDQPAIEPNVKPLQEPEVIPQSEPEVIPPSEPDVTPPKEPEVVQVPEPEHAQVIWTEEPAAPQKVRKSRLWILWVVTGAVVLGAASWF